MTRPLSVPPRRGRHAKPSQPWATRDDVQRMLTALMLCAMVGAVLGAFIVLVVKQWI